jgi:transcriptional regulator with XRE-family HTH domain
VRRWGRTGYGGEFDHCCARGRARSAVLATRPGGCALLARARFRLTVVIILRIIAQILRNNNVYVNMKNEETVQSLPERIAGLRVGKGLSQQALADALEVSLRTVQNWEGGEAAPQGKNLRRLSEVFGMSIPFLLDGKSGPEGHAARGESGAYSPVPFAMASTTVLDHLLADFAVKLTTAPEAKRKDLRVAIHAVSLELQRRAEAEREAEERGGEPPT